MQHIVMYCGTLLVWALTVQKDPNFDTYLLSATLLFWVMKVQYTRNPDKTVNWKRVMQSPGTWEPSPKYALAHNPDINVQWMLTSVDSHISVEWILISLDSDNLEHAYLGH